MVKVTNEMREEAGAILAKLGVEVHNENGGFKSVNDILNQLVNVWDTLSKEEMKALAEALAGVVEPK